MQIFSTTPQPKRAKIYNMNTIRTDPPMENKPQRPLKGLLLIAALVAIILAVPKLKPEYAIGNPASQTTSNESRPNTQQTLIASADQTDVQIKEVYLSDDCTQATIKLSIINNMVKPVIKTEITYTVNDNDGYEIAKAAKTITKFIMPNEEYEDTETINLETIPQNGIEAKAHVLCYYWN